MPSYSSARCTQCLTNTPLRFYSTSKSKSKSKSATITFTPKGQIPPESPRYIAIPQSRQIEAIHRPWIKGVLPIPRKIFPRDSKKDKSSPQYIDATAPLPRSPMKKLPNDPAVADYVQYKAKQAMARRRNLRESLVELRNRKQLLDHEMATRSAAKLARNHKLLYAPQRDDERFTATSTPQAMQPSVYGGLPDPDREVRVAEMRQRTQAKEAAKREERRNMLHTLYMNARDFITTPAELDRLVDHVFDDEDQFTTGNTRGENIWNFGYPETVETLLGNQHGGANGGANGGKAVERSEGYGPATRKRLDRIGEELTGGKMDLD